MNLAEEHQMMSETKFSNYSTGINSPLPRVAVLILNWRKAKTTIACLNSLSKTKNVKIEVYLLDNESKLDSLHFLKQKISDTNLPIHLFSSYQNLGFASGVNYLINQIKIERFDYFFLLNNDAKVNENTISNLVEESKKHQFDLIGPVTENSPESCSRRWPYWIFGIRKPGKFNPQKDGWHTCYNDGSALLLTRKVVKTIINERGYLLKNKLFVYTEDTELGLFASELGYKSFVTTKAVYEHTRGNYTDEKRHSITYYYICRNRLSLAKNYLPPLLKPIFHIYYIVSRVIIFSIQYLKGNSKNGSAIWQGLVDGYRRKFGKWELHR